MDLRATGHQDLVRPQPKDSSNDLVKRKARSRSVFLGFFKLSNSLKDIIVTNLEHALRYHRENNFGFSAY
jgi:hypothetical protein